MIHPNVPAIMVTPICPHSLSFRPIVVPAGVELMVKSFQSLSAEFRPDVRSHLSTDKFTSVLKKKRRTVSPVTCRTSVVLKWTLWSTTVNSVCLSLPLPLFSVVHTEHFLCEISIRFDQVNTRQLLNFLEFQAAWMVTVYPLPSLNRSLCLQMPETQPGFHLTAGRDRRSSMETGKVHWPSSQLLIDQFVHLLM